MNRWIFAGVTLLATIYVGLTLAEAIMYSLWDKAANDQVALQSRVPAIEKINDFTQNLVHRIAIDSYNDPLLKEILRKNGVKVNFTDPPQEAAAASPPGEPIPPSPPPQMPATTSETAQQTVQAPIETKGGSNE